MPEKKLASALSDLHEDLVNADTVDQETRDKLQTLMRDIQRILGDTESRDPESVEPVKTDLQSLLLNLESEYPTTAGLLHRVADGLANLGI